MSSFKSLNPSVCQTLLVHHQGVHLLLLYKTITKQYQFCLVTVYTAAINVLPDGGPVRSDTRRGLNF